MNITPQSIYIIVPAIKERTNEFTLEEKEGNVTHYLERKDDMIAMSEEDFEKLIAKISDWSFRHGWKERSRMTGVNKRNLDRQYFEQIRIMLSNKHYEKAFDNEYLGIIHPKK